MDKMHRFAIAALLAAATVSSALAGTVPLPQAARGGDGIATAMALDAS